MDYKIDTSILPPYESVNAWREYLAKEYSLDSSQQVRVIGKNFFRASHQRLKFGDLFVERMSASPHVFSYSGAHGESVASTHIVIGLPLKGGAISFANNGEIIQHSPGNVYIFDRSLPRTVRFTRRFQAIAICVPRSRMEQIFPRDWKFKHIECSSQIVTAGLLAEIIRTMDFYVEKLRDDPLVISKISDAFVEALTALIYSLPQLKNAPASQLETYHKARIRNWVKDNLHSNLTVENISVAVGLSPSYIHKLFSNEPLSLMRWVVEERLERCRQDLQSGLLLNRSIKEISYSWGFSDQAHFSHTFRDKFGASPSEYREKQFASMRADSANVADLLGGATEGDNVPL